MTLSVHALLDPSGDPIVLYSPRPPLSVTGELSTLSTISPSVNVARAASVSVSTSAAIAASASVTVFTDISDQLVAPGSGNPYSLSSLRIPAWGGNYSVTTTSMYPDNYSLGVDVAFDVPSNPSVEQSVTVQYRVTGRQRQFVHRMETVGRAAFGYVDGRLVEPNSTAGSTATLTYTWDVATQRVRVSAYSGAVTVRDHGPVETASIIPLTFSPETRAEARFTTDHQPVAHTELAKIPAATRTLLMTSSAFQGLDIVSGTGQMQESLYWRHYLNEPTFDETVNGLTRTNDVGAAATSWPTQSAILHEMGHVTDFLWLGRSGYARNLSDYYVPIDYGTVELLYLGGAADPSVIIYKDEGTGVDTDSLYLGEPYGYAPVLQDEIEVVKLWNGVSHSVWWSASVQEWIAQMIGSAWVENPAVPTNLYDFFRSTGVLPGAVSTTSPPSPVTGLSVTSNAGTVVRLAWTPPSSSGYARPVIRRAVGSTAPASATDGVAVPVLVNSADYGTVLNRTCDVGLAPNTTYSYAVFARNYAGRHSTAVTTTVTTPA